MPRRPKQAFHCAPLAELTRQLLFAPPTKRAEQVRRAERLHDEIDTDSAYPFEYLIYRITGYRPDARDESTLLVGEAVRPDLRLIIDQLSRSIDLPADDEPGAPIEDVAARLSISAKTVHRWRKVGLRWRWVVPNDGGQSHIVITDAALNRFIEQHPTRVKRASRFCVLSTQERDRVLARAREIAAGGDSTVTLNRVAAQLAEETGRALETIRLILEKHDRTAPEAAIFTGSDRPLAPRQQRLIERAHRRGIRIGRIAERLNRSRYTIHRVLRTRRAAAARLVDLRYVHGPTFDRDDADEVILRQPLDEVRSPSPAALSEKAAAPASADDLPEPLRALFRQDAIAGARQRTLFIRYNYLKYKAHRVRAALDRHEPRAAELDRFDALLNEARQVAGVLVRANLPTLLSVTRRHMIGENAGRGGRLLELLEAGHKVLLDAIESYNAAWSHTFTSYLTNRLLTHFAQAAHANRAQARRRRSAAQVHQRLIDHARAHGIELEPWNR